MTSIMTYPGDQLKDATPTPARVSTGEEAQERFIVMQIHLNLFSKDSQPMSINAKKKVIYILPRESEKTVT